MTPRPASATIDVEDVLIPHELARRPARAPDYEGESRALAELASVMAESPHAVLQELADRALALCRAGSAGVSVWDPEDPARADVFVWRATAGEYTRYVGATLPRHFSPCGVVVDRDACLLMREPVRAFPYIAELASPCREVLLVPFHRAGAAVGTVWVVAHDDDTRFDSEDARLVATLTKFASAAIHTLARIEAAERAEGAQRHRDEHLRALVTATSDVIYRMSGDWEEMFPADGRELIASNSEPIRGWMDKHIPDFERARVRERISHAITQKETFELEHQVVRPDGTLGWTFSRGIPVLDEHGEVAEWLGAASDITRRKQAEERLRDLGSRMEAALAAGTIGTFSWDIHADRLFGDPSLASIFGVEAEAVAGGSVNAVFDAIHEADRERVRVLLAEAVVRGGRYESDFRVAGKDSGWRWLTARGHIERDAQGRPSRVSGVVIDVSERKEAEAALAHVTAESERRKRLYEAALSNTPDFVYVFDLEHRFTFANEALLSVWGKTLEEAVGKTCLELGYEPWHAAMHDREIEEVRATKQAIRGEVPFAGFVGGARRVYDYIFAPVFGASGDVEAVAGVTRDVTDRKSMEQELRDADRKKDDFIAVLAHELRNPLAPVATGLTLLDDGADPATTRKTLGIMQRQVTHMVRLIDDLLDVSRITREKLTLRKERVALTQVVDSALEGSLPNVQRRKHTLRTSFAHADLLLDADQTRIAQVVSNLLDNASKYTPEGGVITLSTRREGDEAVITVEDSGLGIPEDQLEHVFEMFSQVNRALDRAQGGLGIGLSLVRRLVQMHGGSVKASSQGADRGSTFTVRLPLAASTPEEVRASLAETPSLGGGAHILVVDDNEDAAELLTLALGGAGYATVSAHDGLSAIAAAAADVPSVAFLDIGLPGMSGYDLARHLRRDRRFDQTVLIALTGWGTQEDQRKALDSGFDMHLTKPVSTRDLHGALSRARALLEARGEG